MLLVATHTKRPARGQVNTNYWWKNLEFVVGEKQRVFPFYDSDMKSGWKDSLNPVISVFEKKL